MSAPTVASMSASTSAAWNVYDRALDLLGYAALNAARPGGGWQQPFVDSRALEAIAAKYEWMQQRREMDELVSGR